jgi:hypothetical protein
MVRERKDPMAHHPLFVLNPFVDCGMKLYFKGILAGLVLTSLAACNNENKTANAAEQIDSTAVGAAVEEGMDPNAEEPTRPASKSDADQKALRKAWEDALKAEQKFLGNKQLEADIAVLKETEDADGMIVLGAIDDAKFKAMKPKELLYYTIFHPESWDQNCSEFMFDAGLIQGISAYLPFETDHASERQISAFKANIADMKALIVDCIHTNKAVSLPLLHAVSEYDVRAAISPLIDLFNTQKPQDDLILSALIEMMDLNEFAEWKNSDVNKQFDGGMRDWIPLTAENVAAIIAIAQHYAAS